MNNEDSLSNVILGWIGRHLGVVTVEKLNKKLEELKFFLQQQQDKIMSAISDFADRVETKFTEVGSSVDGLVTSMNGLTGDIANLKKQIADLQNSPGAITPEDQARLDKIETGVNSLADRASGVASSLAALDAQTEEAPTPTPS